MELLALVSLGHGPFPKGTWGWSGPHIHGLKGQVTRWGCPNVPPVP